MLKKKVDMTDLPEDGHELWKALCTIRKEGEILDEKVQKTTKTLYSTMDLEANSMKVLIDEKAPNYQDYTIALSFNTADHGTTDRKEHQRSHWHATRSSTQFQRGGWGDGQRKRLGN